MSRFSFQDLWVTQAITQKEKHWGPLDDQSIMIKLNADPNLSSVEEKIIARAKLLAQREGLTETLSQWKNASKLALWCLCFLAILSGTTLAFNALDTQKQSVNILIALIALLGLHSITFLLWLTTLFRSWNTQGLLGKTWLWLSQKLARSPNASLAVQSFIHTTAKSMYWIIATVTHGIWLIILMTALIVFLALLASQHYSFVWETTILSEQTFVQLTHILGFLPSLIGFPIPDNELIVQSNNQIATIKDAQKTWSIWLTGQVLVWGIALRFISLLIALTKTFLSLQKLTLKSDDIAYASLRHRFTQYTEKIGIDSQAPHYQLPAIQTQTQAWNNDRLILGIELPPTQSWPIIPLHDSVSDAGNIDTREERHQLLTRLSQHPVQDLLIVCNGQQTPDRGTAYFIRDISQYAQQTKVYLQIEHPEQSRLTLWQDALTQMGIKPEMIWHHPQQLFAWTQQ